MSPGRKKYDPRQPSFCYKCGALCPSYNDAMEHCRGRRDQALTARQLSIVALVAAGVPYRTIAAQLGEKSENTIKDQVRKMCKKLKLPSNGRALASWYTQYIAQVRSHDKLDA